MTETTAAESASEGRTKRWVTPLLITAYIVAVLLISGLSRAKDQQTVAGPVGESASAQASDKVRVFSEGSDEIRR